MSDTMNITQVDSASSATPTIVEQGSNTSLDKMAFLKLLTVQLSNQDPLNPMDSSGMAEQQALFAQVEQLMNLNTNMETFMESQNDLMLGIASVFNTLESTSFLGKEVSFATKVISVGDEGMVNTLYYDLSDDAMVGYTVKDANGNVVRASGSTSVQAGSRIPVAWDGKNGSGDNVEPGQYAVTLDVVDKDGEGITVTPYSDMRVSAIDFKSGTPVLKLSDGRSISVANIVALSEPEEA
jgi:flagellar basal-body rod modification protein FlgD